MNTNIGSTVTICGITGVVVESTTRTEYTPEDKKLYKIEHKHVTIRDDTGALISFDGQTKYITLWNGRP
jgi:RNase P/RNase MRP subunit p29